MDLKKLFPLSYEKSTLVSIITYLVVAIIAGALIWLAGALTGWIPVAGAIIGWALRIVSIIIEVYVITGIVLKILLALNVIK